MIKLTGEYSVDANHQVKTPSQGKKKKSIGLLDSLFSIDLSPKKSGKNKKESSNFSLENKPKKESKELNTKEKLDELNELKKKKNLKKPKINENNEGIKAIFALQPQPMPKKGIELPIEPPKKYVTSLASIQGKQQQNSQSSSPKTIDEIKWHQEIQTLKNIARELIKNEKNEKPVEFIPIKPENKMTQKNEVKTLVTEINLASMNLEKQDKSKNEKGSKTDNALLLTQASAKKTTVSFDKKEDNIQNKDEFKKSMSYSETRNENSLGNNEAKTVLNEVRDIQTFLSKEIEQYVDVKMVGTKKITIQIQGDEVGYIQIQIEKHDDKILVLIKLDHQSSNEEKMEQMMENLKNELKDKEIEIEYEVEKENQNGEEKRKEQEERLKKENKEVDTQNQNSDNKSFDDLLEVRE